MAKRVLVAVVVALVLSVALAWAAGEATKLTAAKPLSVEVRWQNVQRAMAENNIRLDPAIDVGDDGRLLLKLRVVDTLVPAAQP